MLRLKKIQLAAQTVTASAQFGGIYFRRGYGRGTREFEERQSRSCDDVIVADSSGGDCLPRELRVPAIARHSAERARIRAVRAGDGEHRDGSCNGKRV